MFTLGRLELIVDYLEAFHVVFAGRFSLLHFWSFQFLVYKYS